MQNKLTFNMVCLSKLLIYFAIYWTQASFAQDTANLSAHVESAIHAIEPNKSVKTAYTKEEISDQLSDTASVRLESIDNQTLQSKQSVIASTGASASTGSGIDPLNTSSARALTANSAPYNPLQREGIHHAVNYAKAAETFCLQARDKNDADAQYALGWMYENGKGVSQDANIAVKFYSMAAKQFHQSARESLSASKGNPNIAKLPECMSKSFKPKEIVLTENSSEATPFYEKGPIYKLVSKIAPRYQIETDLAMAFIAVESGFNPNATSAKNAQGLMQLIPETAARFKVKNAYDPEQNIKGGLAYLEWLLAYYEGDIKLVAAAYNAGENTVDKYKGVPPYPETQKYVKKIASLYKKTHHPFRDKAVKSKKSSVSSRSG